MRKDIPYIRLVIKDGNRTVNWEFKRTDTILDILNRWNFEWEPDTVRVADMPIPDSLLTETVEHFVDAATGMGFDFDALKVTMKGIPEKPPEKKKEAVAEEVVADGG